MSIQELLAAGARIGKELGQLAHDLAHLDLKALSAADQAALSRLQRCSHDGAISFGAALTPKKD